MAALSSLPALPYVYCTQGDVEAILSIDGVSLRLDDDQGGTVDATELAYLTTAMINWATARVNMYLQGRYDAVQLSQSYAVNDITAILVAARLCRRRGNPAAKSILELQEESMKLLEQIKAHEMSLEDVPERTSGSPSWRNIHHSRHLIRRNRVQRPISEKTPPARPVNTDLPAEYAGSELYWLP